MTALDKIIKHNNKATESACDSHASACDRMRNICSLESYIEAFDALAIITSTNIKGTILYANEQFTRISGYSESELIGQNHRILNSGHHPPAFFKEMWRTIARGKVWRGEIKNRAKNGSTYWVDTAIVPFKDNRGKIQGYTSARIDITARKLDEEKLLEKLLARNVERDAALNNMVRGLSMFDAEARLIVCNRIYHQIYDLPEELTQPGTPFLDIIRYHVKRETGRDSKEDIEKERKWVEKHVAALAGGKSFSHTQHLENGRTVVVTNQPLPNGGWIDLQEDITEKRRAEQKIAWLARIVEDSINEVCVFDATTLKFVEVNASAIQNLGYTLEELKELTPLDLNPEYSRTDFGALVHPLRTGERDTIRFETVHRRKDGSEYDVEVLLQKIGSNDRPVFAAIIEDVTDRNRAEEQLRQAQKMEAVGQLTGGLAHDFNNLLGVILGNLQLLERSVPDSEKSKMRIKAALKAVDKGAELTRRLLAFARRQKLETETIDPNPLIEDLSDLLRRTLGEKITLECRLGENIPYVRVDPHQLESAILNLAVNARDAMPDGGNLTIESDVVYLDEDYVVRESDVIPGDYVGLVVIDTGVGIPADTIDKVCEPFFTTKEVGQGSGLGLSMVYGFIKQSGGHMQIYSEVGRGTTIRMYLPVERRSTFAREHPSAPAGEEVGGQETILVVEDQTDVREIAVALLEDLGYTVFEAENGRQALAVLESKSEIELLFTDVVMPGGIDGTELAGAARKVRPGLPVLFASGYAAAAVLRNAEVEAANNLVAKPYRRADLAAKIRQALDEQAAAREGVLSAAE